MRGRALILRVAAAAGVLALSACSLLPSSFGGGPEKPQPAELQPDPRLLAVRQVWSARIGTVDFPLAIAVSGNVAAVASGDGTVAGFDATSGREQWRGSVPGGIAAGVGFDGGTAAVITRNNELVALASGKVAWQRKLPALSYTPPLVAGARVFVLAADRSVSAFDGGTGRRLWSQQRPGEDPVEKLVEEEEKEP